MYGRKISEMNPEELHALIVDAMEKAMQTAIKAAYEEGYKTALDETMKKTRENSGDRVENYTNYLFDKISKDMTSSDVETVSEEMKFMFDIGEIRYIMSNVTKNKSKLRDTFDFDYNYKALMKLLMK